MAPCVGCGIDEDAISVPDALAAIRSFPRRYREALASVPEPALRSRPDPDTWSVVEYAVHAREVLELLAMSLPIVLEEPDTRFPEIDVTQASATRPDWVLDPDLVVAGITKAANALVTRGETTPWEAWDRTFMIGDTEHPASWIVAHAAHEGGHHLRDIERVARALGYDTEE
jgi:DinB superfamily